MDPLSHLPLVRAERRQPHDLAQERHIHHRQVDGKRHRHSQQQHRVLPGLHGKQRAVQRHRGERLEHLDRYQHTQRHRLRTRGIPRSSEYLTSFLRPMWCVGRMREILPIRTLLPGAQLLPGHSLAQVPGGEGGQSRGADVGTSDGITCQQPGGEQWTIK